MQNLPTLYAICPVCSLPEVNYGKLKTCTSLTGWGHSKAIKFGKVAWCSGIWGWSMTKILHLQYLFLLCSHHLKVELAWSAKTFGISQEATAKLRINKHNYCDLDPFTSLNIGHTPPKKEQSSRYQHHRNLAQPRPQHQWRIDENMCIYIMYIIWFFMFFSCSLVISWFIFRWSDHGYNQNRPYSSAHPVINQLYKSTSYGWVIKPTK